MTLKAKLLTVMMIALSGCSGGSNSSSTQPAVSAAGLPVISVKIHNTDGATLQVSAEVATTQQQKATGLMYRTSMAADAGMLFVFSSEQTLSFWMKNTYIQLDMIFLDEDKKIVDINRNAQPGTTNTYTSVAPAKYVLEVNGGYCEGNGVQIGNQLEFDGY